MMPQKTPVWTPELLEAPHETPDKADRVRTMFNAIAPRYEFVNSLFSVGRDAVWRRKAVRLACTRPGDDVLDIATGTGDFARAFARGGARRVVGCDFAHEMLTRARQGGAKTNPLRWCEADALNLPFCDESFSITCCAFGVRNFADLSGGLKEMYRVLRPGGRAVVLEFSRPRNGVARHLYEFYSFRFMPVAASWVSGDRSGAYRYLPRSVVSFPDAEQMCTHLREAGFDSTSATPLTLGAVTVCIGYKSATWH